MAQALKRPESRPAKRVLISLYFRRDLRIEGGGTLLRELANALHTLGHEAEINGPIDGEGMGCRTIDSRTNGDGSYGDYVKQLHRLSAEYDCVWIIEQSPATGALSRQGLPEGHGILRLIASPYQTLEELLGGPRSMQYFKHWAGKNKMLARLRPRTGTMVVSTEYQREQLLLLGASRDQVHVIPFGISGNVGEPPSKTAARAEYGLPDGFIVSYLGHYSPIKGVPVLVEAFRTLAASNREAHLAVAWSGKGDEAGKVRRLLKSPELQGRVTELGIVNPLHFLAASDVTVLPFVHSSFPHFPLVMIEAFASGTPIVASDIGGIREMVLDGETGLLVRPNDPAALTGALERLTRELSLLNRISTNQLSSFRTRYSASVAVDRLLQLS